MDTPDTEAGTPLTVEEEATAKRLARIYIERDFFDGNDYRAEKAARDDARDWPATDPAGLDVDSMQLQMHIAFCKPGTIHSTNPRAACTVLAHQFAARLSVADDE